MVSHEKMRILANYMVKSGEVAFLIIFCLSFLSCQNSEKSKINSLVSYWQHREIIFPQNCIFTSLGEDTVDVEMESPYKIVLYLDSIGCISCKAQLSNWKKYIESLKEENVPVLIFMNICNLKEIQFILKRESFSYPVCIDMKDSLNKLNHFPSDIMFQTFLLDKDNKIIAIGNPIHNPQVKELYLKFIRGRKVEQEKETIKTKVDVDKTSVSLGHFNWQKEQNAIFILKNIGKAPLALQGVNTSCGCITVRYSPEPVQPGKEIALEVIYKARHPEHFNKTISVYCNAEVSPIMLTISGNAQ